jgi:cell division protein ZapA
MIEVTILGRRIPLREDGDAAYVREVADYVGSKMEEVLRGSQTTQTLNVAILAAMNIADDYFKAEGRNRTLTRDVSTRVDELIRFIDEKLGEEET